jgi:hypothetical protein
MPCTFKERPRAPDQRRPTECQAARPAAPCPRAARWADGFAGSFPVEHAGRRFMNWKIPVPDRLVRPPTTTAAIQAECAQCLIDAAAHVAAAKPADLAHARAVAIISLPDMFASELCVFFDAAYFRSFTERTADWQRWTPLPKGRSLAEEMGLSLPDDFVVRGFAEAIHDEETGETREGEVWLIGECGPGRAAG